MEKTMAYRAAEVAPVLDITEAKVEKLYRMIEMRRRAARYLHAPPLLADSSYS